MVIQSTVHLGIKPSKIYLPHNHYFYDKTLLDFLVSHFSHIPKASWENRFENGLISTVQGDVLSMNTIYQAGQTILYYRQVDNEPIIPFEPSILHLDEHLLVVDKPHFLPVTPSGQYVSQTLLAKLARHPDLQQRFSQDISPLHRLDKDTAGVMLLSVNPASRAMYHQLFAHRQIHKTYEAIAPTRTDLTYPFAVNSRLVRGEPFFLTQTVEGAPNAHTTIELIENLGELSRYRLLPLTGKKHQLRVHMASLGMPLCHDNFYPTVQDFGAIDTTKPLKLLAKSLEFIDPITGQYRMFSSGLTLI